MVQSGTKISNYLDCIPSNEVKVGDTTWEIIQGHISYLAVHHTKSGSRDNSDRTLQVTNLMNDSNKWGICTLRHVEYWCFCYVHVFKINIIIVHGNNMIVHGNNMIVHRNTKGVNFFFLSPDRCLFILHTHIFFIYLVKAQSRVCLESVYILIT